MNDFVLTGCIQNVFYAIQKKKKKEEEEEKVNILLALEHNTKK